MKLVNLWVNDKTPKCHYLMGEYTGLIIRFEHVPSNTPKFDALATDWDKWHLFHKLKKDEIKQIHLNYRIT